MPMFKIYVGNLDPRTTVEALKPYFEPFGEAVDEIILVMDEQGEPRGFAIVLFRDPQLGQLAVETLTGKKINGREIQINEAVKKGKRILPTEEKAPRTSPLGPRAFQRPGSSGGFRPGAPRSGDSRPSGMASSRPGFGASAGGASSRFNRNPRRAPGAAGGPSSPMSSGSGSASSGPAVPGAEQGAIPSASGPGVTPSAGSTADHGTPRPPLSSGLRSRSLGGQSPSAPGAPGAPDATVTPGPTSRQLGGAPSMRPGAPRPPVPGGSSTQSRSLGSSSSRPIGGGGLPRPTASGTSRPLGASAPRPMSSPTSITPRAATSSPSTPPAASAAPAPASPAPAAPKKATKSPASVDASDSVAPAKAAPVARPRAVKKKPNPEA